MTTDELEINPVYQQWEKLLVYRLNREQVWLAERLEDALEGAALRYGAPIQEIFDEMHPPEQMGNLRWLLFEVERSVLERECARMAMQKLNEGLMPPLFVGLLAV